MKVLEDNQIDISIDHRIARCRHERLRQALQFQAPGRQAPLQAAASRSKIEVKAVSEATPQSAMKLNPVERFFVGVIKVSLSLLAMILTPLTC